MLSFLLRWDYCWKYEFNTDVTIENYYHNDGLRFKPCSDERQNGFKDLKLKRCKF